MLPQSVPQAQPCKGNAAEKGKQKSLHRASTACVSCRARRVRCVTSPGKSGCSNCLRDGKWCLMRNNDERKRRCSRQYVNSLTDRIEELQALLDKQASDQPIYREPGPISVSQGESTELQQITEAESPQSHAQQTVQNEPNQFDQYDLLLDDSVHAQQYASLPMTTSPVTSEIVERLKSPRTQIGPNNLDGRLRYLYFGPTTNAYLVSPSTYAILDKDTLIAEQHRKAHRMINSLAIETHDYLMDLFWDHFNCCLHVTHRAAYDDDRDNGRRQFYSYLLHICQLAMGFRFADKDRVDVQRLTLAPGESNLHQEARYMIEHELKQPGGLPTISALLLLGDLECGVGRDNFGWMLHSMASRLAFDLGLHLDISDTDVSERELGVRSLTLWACVIYDQYWALFSRRPTSIKIEDIEMVSNKRGLERLGTCRPAGPDKSLETDVYEALLDVMEIASKIADTSSRPTRTISRGAQLKLITLDRELHSWYTRLSLDLNWTDQTAATAPSSLFLLHQQYYSILILLHVPFVQQAVPLGPCSLANSDLSFVAPKDSIQICKEAAVAISTIYRQYQQRFDIGKLSIFCLQHIGTAATALIAVLVSEKRSEERAIYMDHLEYLCSVLIKVSSIYRPADVMVDVLRDTIAELQNPPVHVSLSWTLDPMKLPRPSTSNPGQSQGTIIPNIENSVPVPIRPHRHRSGRQYAEPRSSARTVASVGFGIPVVSLEPQPPSRRDHPYVSLQPGFAQTTSRTAAHSCHDDLGGKSDWNYLDAGDMRDNYRAGLSIEAVENFGSNDTIFVENEVWDNPFSA